MQPGRKKTLPDNKVKQKTITIKVSDQEYQAITRYIKQLKKDVGVSTYIRNMIMRRVRNEKMPA